MSEYYLNGVIVFVFYCCYINCKYLKKLMVSINFKKRCFKVLEIELEMENVNEFNDLNVLEGF